MYDQTTSVELSHSSSRCTKVSWAKRCWFVDPLDHYKHVLTCAGVLFTIQNLACTWCLARLYNSRGRWTVTIAAKSKLRCVFKLVSIPYWYFIPRLRYMINRVNAGLPYNINCITFIIIYIKFKLSTWSVTV